VFRVPPDFRADPPFLAFLPSVVTPTLIWQLLQHSNTRVDGSFIATILETATVAVIYMAWRSITEGELRFVLGCLLVLSAMFYGPFVVLSVRLWVGMGGWIVPLHEERLYLMSTMTVSGHRLFQHVLGGGVVRFFDHRSSTFRLFHCLPPSAAGGCSYYGGTTGVGVGEGIPPRVDVEYLGLDFHVSISHFPSVGLPRLSLSLRLSPTQCVSLLTNSFIRIMGRRGVLPIIAPQNSSCRDSKNKPFSSKERYCDRTQLQGVNCNVFRLS
jgi:hypothetical protein